MKKTNACPKCGSVHIVRDAKVRSKGEGHGELFLAVAANPDALIFCDYHKSEVTAWVCASCGYTEFYAPAAAGLFHAQKMAREKRANPI